MRKIVCDKCGRQDLAPLRPEWWAVKITLPKETLQVDLCERCAARLKTFIRDPDPQAA